MLSVFIQAQCKPLREYSFIGYKKDKGSSNEILDSGKKMHFYTLEREMKFCPGEEKGSINKEVLNVWLSAFSKRLNSQNQSSLFYKKIGKLFACSPTGSDGAFPHETIREKIEEIGNEELINSFASAIIYGRGMYKVTDGKDEYKLGQKYEEISRKYLIRYPKTAKIFSIISRRFFNESEYEKRIAETEIY